MFVEVKTRRALSGRRDVIDNITEAKRQRLRRLALTYLARFRRVPPHRIDIVAVLLDPDTGAKPKIEHIAAAV